MKNTFKSSKGITLVALVITIIILLILAGISISALTNTGIFGKAKDAKSKSELADAQEKITLLELTKRANNSSLPKVEIVDLKQELANGNRSMLSFNLYQSIEQNLKDKLQTILFLNRRGYSTFIMCRNCGYTVKCKNCIRNLEKALDKTGKVGYTNQAVSDKRKQISGCSAVLVARLNGVQEAVSSTLATRTKQ